MKKLTIATKSPGQIIYEQISSQDRMALPAWGAKDMVVFNAGSDAVIKNHLGGFKFKVKGKAFTGMAIIYLMPNDTYTVVFATLKGTNFKVLINPKQYSSTIP